MKKGAKKGMNRIIFLVLFIIFSTTAYASIDLTINASLNSHETSFITRSETNSTSGYDGFDFDAPTNPDNYSQLYSTVEGSQSLALDSWNITSLPRTINLTYLTSTADSGTLTLTWNLEAENLAITLIDHRYVSDYSNISGNAVNMVSEPSYSTTTNGSNMFFTITISEVVATTTTSSSGGGSSSSYAPPFKSFVVSYDKFKQGYTRDIREDDIIKFDLTGNQEYHTLKILSIEEERVILEIQSNRIEFALSPNEEKELEITGDKYNDIYIKLENIENNKLTLTIKETNTISQISIDGSTCTDGVKNCHTLEDKKILCEQGVDCGGPCSACIIKEKPEETKLNLLQTLKESLPLIKNIFLIVLYVLAIGLVLSGLGYSIKNHDKMVFYKKYEEYKQHKKQIKQIKHKELVIKKHLTNLNNFLRKAIRITHKKHEFLKQTPKFKPKLNLKHFRLPKLHIKNPFRFLKNISLKKTEKIQKEKELKSLYKKHLGKPKRIKFKLPKIHLKNPFRLPRIHLKNPFKLPKLNLKHFRLPKLNLRNPFKRKTNKQELIKIEKEYEEHNLLLKQEEAKLKLEKQEGLAQDNIEIKYIEAINSIIKEAVEKERTKKEIKSLLIKNNFPKKLVKDCIKKHFKKEHKAVQLPKLHITNKIKKFLEKRKYHKKAKEDLKKLYKKHLDKLQEHNFKNKFKLPKIHLKNPFRLPKIHLENPFKRLKHKPDLKEKHLFKNLLKRRQHQKELQKLYKKHVSPPKIKLPNLRIKNIFKTRKTKKELRHLYRKHFHHHKKPLIKPIIHNLKPKLPDLKNKLQKYKRTIEENDQKAKLKQQEMIIKRKQEQEEIQHRELSIKHKHVLHDYLSKAVNKGLTKEEIEGSLIKNGWPREFIIKYCDIYFKVNERFIGEKQQTFQKETIHIEKVKDQMTTLNEFFEKAIEKGLKKDKIEQLLIENGWPEDIVHTHSNTFFLR